VNEKRIEQVIEIERQAQAIRETAAREAEQLPVETEKAALVLLERAQSEARAEAQQVIDDAREEQSCQRILAEAEAEAKRTEALAMTHFDRTVSRVLNWLVGRE
jgi:vacuolar-type H+-ATPase subunit H